MLEAGRSNLWLTIDAIENSHKTRTGGSPGLQICLWCYSPTSSVLLLEHELHDADGKVQLNTNDSWSKITWYWYPYSYKATISNSNLFNFNEPIGTSTNPDFSLYRTLMNPNW